MITIVELVTLIRRKDNEFMQMIEFAEEVVVSLDTNGDNEISRCAPPPALCSCRAGSPSR